MTELQFKGKEFVWNHHLAVPFRPLVPDAAKGIGDVRMDGNLIIQGDNLHALKALLPMYAGRVDCIFIDPPYNTGNEGWAYNDKVNAPMIKEWLAANPIGIEDGLRHDKWCAMMWPRLRLLHELLADDGSLWMTLDDNESHRAKILLDEIFGEENFVANIAWRRTVSRGVSGNGILVSHDNLLVYSKSDAFTPNRLSVGMEGYRNPDNDPRGPYKAQKLERTLEGARPTMTFPIETPDGAIITRTWSVSPITYKRLLDDNRIVFSTSGTPYYKQFHSEYGGTLPDTWWNEKGGFNQEAAKELKAIFGEQSIFDTPKPTELIAEILRIAAKEDSIILDSFAGSGTTAHAVLEANKRDGGNRRFILVEMEDYADRLTAERVRRVINGYPFKGTQKTELLRESLNWSKLQKADRLTDAVDKIETLHGHEYDRITKQVKDGELIVTGEKQVDERAEGLGGTFTYCTLGAPLELDRVLTGDTLPAWDALGAVLFNMATSQPMDMGGADQGAQYLGQTDAQHLWLIYRPDLEWLKSPEAALSLSFARKIAAEKPDKSHLVFAPARHVSQKMLDAQNLPVQFVPLPFALYRIERG